ncbi:Hypothetical predicted protein [Podarcis lilfordi]|uniref:Uncharacterized protein n=1 Tax=Podarcis lilfordi TaxID=74358 RepID=A0AA35LAU4_9SAUR|nr:Hypothetical predicted protein [Podarcis lilfordi]
MGCLGKRKLFREGRDSVAGATPTNFQAGNSALGEVLKEGKAEKRVGSGRGRGRERVTWPGSWPKVGHEAER